MDVERILGYVSPTDVPDVPSFVEGVINHETGTIDAPIGRDPNNRQKMKVTDENSKDAITHLRVLKRFKDATLIELQLETGRTHQIRVHFSHMGHPLIGDELYGEKDEFLKLHCYYLSFNHPWDENKKIEIKKYPNWIEEEVCQE